MMVREVEGTATLGQEGRPAPKRWLQQKAPATLVVVLTVAAALLRTSRLELMEFRLDEAFQALLGLEILEGIRYPLVGHIVGSVSVPMSHGAVIAYFSAAVFRVMGTSPTNPVLAANVLGSLAVVVSFLVGRRFFGNAAGIISAVLIAFAPWMILYGRILWPHSAFYPVILPITFVVLYRGAMSRSAAMVFLWGVLVGLSAQMHLSGLVLLPIGFVFLSLYFRHLLAMVASVVGFVAGYSPILLNDYLTGWMNLRGVVGLSSNAVIEEGGALYRLLKFLWNLENMISGQGMWWSKLAWRTDYLPPWVEWGQGIALGGLFALAVMTLLWRLIPSIARGMRFENEAFPNRADLLLALYVIAPLGYLAVSGVQVLRHHFIFVVPFLFLLTGRGLSLIEGKLRGLAWSLLVLGVALNIFTTIAAYHYLSEERVGWDHGTVFEDKERAVDTVVQLSDASFVVDASRTREALAYYFLFRTHRSALFDEFHGLIASGTSLTAPVDYAIIEPSFYEMPSDFVGRTTYSVGEICIVKVGETSISPLTGQTRARVSAAPCAIASEPRYP